MKKVRLEALVLSASVFCALVGASCASLQAQEVVHAVTGVVTAVSPADNSITIKTNDGSEGLFHYRKDLKADIEFDKDVRSGTAAPSAFNKVGDHVVAYYFGEGTQRTIVAIKDFGASALEVASGTVVKAKHHAIVLKTDSGATETFDIAKDASAETPMGVVGGFKLDVDSGTRATVRYTDENGMKVAQFIRTD
jgi:hypothetical protein